jgi:hypothetical protein
MIDLTAAERHNLTVGLQGDALDQATQAGHDFIVIYTEFGPTEAFTIARRGDGSLLIGDYDSVTPAFDWDAYTRAVAERTAEVE